MIVASRTPWRATALRLDQGPRVVPPLKVAMFVLTLCLCLQTNTPADRDPLGQLADPFRQLEELLPTPNLYRTASGAPGAGYWQQRVDYDIAVSLEETERRIRGRETITYWNQSPDALRYLWVQLDNNILAPESHANLTSDGAPLSDMPFGGLNRMLARQRFDGGVKIEGVWDASGEALPYIIVDTMMRVDLPETLYAGSSRAFEIAWNYQINNDDEVGARTGAEFFKEDGNWIFELAHWFPRLAAYTDVNGWQHKQFLGSGEFTLEFGDYTVAITVPGDHVVAASGVLQNPTEVLSEDQRERLRQAATAATPQFVITPEEALANEQSGPDGSTKTWIFKADNVRDFAWASSRKFIWDAQGWTRPSDPKAPPVLAMSFYPKEGEPLWSRYSTHAVVHTLDVYSKHTFEYPYPVAISVNGPVGGMEYPMICFNGPRPEKDGTYSERTKYGLISVVIHEVGHNWFPMIVNSDERQWTWMDEGLNSFCEYLACMAWEPDYPSRRGEPQGIVGYMQSSNQVPIMTNSDSLIQFGPNAYSKPATALNILRESVLGRELFDFAFAEYSKRWAFKRPEPADLFRTLEDASAVDLDWFWRGWFYSTGFVDQALLGFESWTIEALDPNIAKAKRREERDAAPETLAKRNNRPLERRSDRFPELLDFYNRYDELDVTQKELETFEKELADLNDDQRALLDSDLHFHLIRVENKGRLVMPVILELTYADGSLEELRIPAEFWRRNATGGAKLVIADQPLVKVVLDPHLEIADVDLSNNTYPPEPKQSRFKLFKDRDREGSNPMREAKEAEERAEEAAAAAAAPAETTPAEPTSVGAADSAASSGVTAPSSAPQGRPATTTPAAAASSVPASKSAAAQPAGAGAASGGQRN
jgi:Peptidase family M1 domain